MLVVGRRANLRSPRGASTHLVDDVVKRASTVVIVIPEYAGPTNHPDRDLVP
jgi:hypothetical protein